MGISRPRSSSAGKLLPRRAVIFGVSGALKSYNIGIPTSEIRVRDPFILADARTKTYYLYAQTQNRQQNSGVSGVEVYRSANLTEWTGPEPVFTAAPDFWGRAKVWAPEVHEYKGRYYLLVTFTADGIVRQQQDRPAIERRGTQILVAESPTGPFKPFHNRAHTPADWMALDGTLWVEGGVPWMVFCHEWIEVADGTVELARLKADLSDLDGPPRTLFRASEAPWARNVVGKYRGYVSDGPFLHRTPTGTLLMIWSSFGTSGYALGVARSESGKISGPWRQLPQPLFAEDGGHGMMFRRFDGQLMLALHQPNRGQLERARFFAIDDSGDTLRLAGKGEPR